MTGGLPDAERRAAAYVRKNAAEAASRSVHELARAAGVSVASVSRMVKRLGYGGFREFRIALARETSSPLSAIYQAIAPGDSAEQTVRKIFGANIYSLQETLKMLDFNACVRTADAIVRARRTIFFGIGTSGHIGQDAALIFSLLGVHAHACADSYSMMVTASRMGKGDFAFGISHSGRSAATVEALQIARENGAGTAGISSFPHAPLAAVSDMFFCTVFPERHAVSSALSPRAAQMCLIDALYVLTAHRGKGLAGVAHVNKLLEDHFRTRERRR